MFPMFYYYLFDRIIWRAQCAAGTFKELVTLLARLNEFWIIALISHLVRGRTHRVGPISEEF